MQTVNTSGVSHVPAGTGESIVVIGEHVTFKAMQAQTNGTLTAIEMVAQPGGGPPLHTHRSSEVFSILDGEFEFTCLRDGAPSVFRAKAGDAVYVPSGEAHTYRAVGGQPGKTLVVLVPGDDMENFFLEAGVPAADAQNSMGGPPDVPAMIAVAAKYGMAFLPPVAP